MVPLDTIFTRLLVIAFDLALSTGPVMVSKAPGGSRGSGTPPLAGSTHQQAVPYRTLRCEWMIRLASSGVRSSRLGLSDISSGSESSAKWSKLLGDRSGVGAER